MSNPSQKRRALDRAIEAWNARDLERYLELYSHRIALYGYTAIPMNKTEVYAYYASLFAAFSDMVLKIHEIIENETQIGVRFSMRATHTGEIRGIQATGRQIAQEGMAILNFDGDRVVERFTVTNLTDLEAQLRD